MQTVFLYVPFIDRNTMAQQLTGQWDLQEAITAQRTATRTATTPVTLLLECFYNSRASSFGSSSTASPLAIRASNQQRAGPAGDPKPSYHICVVEGSTVIVSASLVSLASLDWVAQLTLAERDRHQQAQPQQQRSPHRAAHAGHAALF